MVSLERQNVVELITRHLLLLLIILLGYVIYGYTLPFVWFLAYAATTAGTVTLLKQLATEARFRTYLRILAVFAIRIALYRIFLIYLWFHEQPEFQIPAVCMLLAAVRFSINQKSRIRTYSAIQAVGDSAVLLSISIIYLLVLPHTIVNLAAGLSFAALLVYYLVTLQQAYVGLATIEEMERRSIQSQKMEAVGRLTGGVAHDFNNILTVVMGNLELYREIDDPAEKEAIVVKAREAAERAGVLTAQLMAFSRQTPLRQEIVDTRAFLTELNKLTERVLPANILLDYTSSEDCQQMWIDRTQLEIALLNLIINARDAMPKGGVIRLIAENYRTGDTAPSATQPDSDYVELTLRDEGEGISGDVIDKVFDPFFTTKAIGEGSGLGLSMAKGFIEQSGGNLQIKSSPGQGTEVCMLIPVKEVSPAAE